MGEVTGGSTGETGGSIGGSAGNKVADNWAADREVGKGSATRQRICRLSALLLGEDVPERWPLLELGQTISHSAASYSMHNLLIRRQTQGRVRQCIDSVVGPEGSVNAKDGHTGQMIMTSKAQRPPPPPLDGRCYT